MAKPYSKRRYQKWKAKRSSDADAAMLRSGGGGGGGFSISDPKGRAPRGKGKEYAAQRWASSKVESTRAEIGRLNKVIGNYRGQASQRRRITKAKARKRLLSEALSMTQSIATSAGSWIQKKRGIQSAFDYASAMYMY